MKYVVSVNRTVKYESAGYAISGTGRKIPLNPRGNRVLAPDGGYWELIRFTSEVTGIEQKKIKDDKFEIPQNYKLKQSE